MFFVSSDIRTTLVKVPLLQLDLLLKMIIWLNGVKSVAKRLLKMLFWHTLKTQTSLLPRHRRRPHLLLHRQSRQSSKRHGKVVARGPSLLPERPDHRRRQQGRPAHWRENHCRTSCFGTEAGPELWGRWGSHTHRCSGISWMFGQGKLRSTRNVWHGSKSNALFHV